MAWLAVDINGCEWIFQNKPKQFDGLWEDEEPKEIVLKNDVEKQDNLDIPEEDDYCKYHNILYVFNFTRYLLI